MSRIEDRILELDPELQSPYEKYKKIQNLKQKQADLEKQKIKEKESSNIQDIKKDDPQSTKYTKSELRPKLQSFFKWQKDEEGEYQVKPEEKREIIEFKPVKCEAKDKILRFLGYQIDVGAKVGEYMEKYQKFYVDSRSHNYLLSKFSELKAGMFQFMLGILGVPIEEIKALQKEALKEAVKENLALFEQNEYNAELILLFKSGKKDKSKKKLFDEVRTQLKHRMGRLGYKEFYTEEKETEIKKDAVKTVLQELLQEKQNLLYMKDFL